MEMNQNNSVYSYNQQQTSLQMVSFLNKVYGFMTGGLLLTAWVAHSVYQNCTPYELGKWLTPCFVAEIILVLCLSAVATKLHPLFAIVGFLGYAALNGVTLSTVFICYQIGSIQNIFLTTAGTFAAMSLFGMVTRKDLTKLGNLCCMALIGVVIASLVNVFLVKSARFDFALSILGVIIFVGLIAWDTQKIKRINEANVNHTGIAILGALTLYLDFINLFLYLLRLFGKRK